MNGRRFKKCIKCNLKWPREENYFDVDIRLLDGLASKCKDCRNKDQTIYRKKNQKKLNIYKYNWAKNNKKSCKESVKKYKNSIKLKVFKHYSKSTKPFCSCSRCKINILDFLTIDHINGNGASFRKKTGLRGLTLYQYLIKNNYPKGYQVLCFNCNCSKKTGNMCIGHNVYLGDKK